MLGASVGEVQDGDGVGAGRDVVEGDVSVGGLGADGVGAAVVEGEAAVDAYLDAGVVGRYRDVAGGAGGGGDGQREPGPGREGAPADGQWAVWGGYLSAGPCDGAGGRLYRPGAEPGPGRGGAGQVVVQGR